MKPRHLGFTLGLVFPTTAMAFDWQGGKWARDRIPVPYLVSNALSDDVPDRQCLEAIQVGYEAWNQLPCSYMRWEYVGRTADDAWGSADGSNISSWRESGWDQPSVVLGITSTITNFQGNIEDADIKYNGQDHGWAQFGDAPGFDGRTDIGSVSAHEVGHALGLGHSNIAGSTMWPSTGPGDINNRSLGADDIRGACEVYPSGGDVPEPGVDPPPLMGDVGFGGDCAMALCGEDLFCIGDGRDQYCSRDCEPGGADCGDGYYCAALNGGGGACARGEDPGTTLGNFGEECGQSRGCAEGLTCVNDDNQFYCTGPCLSDMCPTDFFCAPLQGGGDVCARGEGPGMGSGGQGQPCDDRGLCGRGLFCLYDPYFTDDNSGEVVPYCTNDCPGNACDMGYRCVPLEPSGQACQVIPSAGRRNVGDQCWVNPESPERAPSCGVGLVCTGFVLERQEVTVKGTCTKNCEPTDCCPEGWGCSELTPVIGQCRMGRSDDEGFECTGGRPGNGDGGDGGLGQVDGGLTMFDGGAPGANPGDGGGGGGGCQQGGARLPLGLLALGVFGLVGLRRFRRRGLGE